MTDFDSAIPRFESWRPSQIVVSTALVFARIIPVLCPSVMPTLGHGLFKDVACCSLQAVL